MNASPSPSPDRMLAVLSPVIEEKCAELQRKRQERLWNRLFLVICLLVVTVPAILVFGGVSLTVLLLPAVLLSLALLLLLPVILNTHGGTEEKTERKGVRIYE